MKKDAKEIAKNSLKHYLLNGAHGIAQNDPAYSPGSGLTKDEIAEVKKETDAIAQKQKTRLINEIKDAVKVSVGYNIEDTKDMFNHFTKFIMSWAPGDEAPIDEIVKGFKEGWIKMKTRTKEAVKKIKNKVTSFNNPNWYVNLDMHTAFHIPYVYNDADPLDYADGITLSSVTIYDVCNNIAPDTTVVRQRCSQLLDLLKGVRGLSGKMPYGIGDLFYYRELGNYAINEYYRLKFALRLSQMYSVTKSRMPMNVITALGFTPSDLIGNRALYVEILTDIANFLTNNLPTFGVEVERIRDLWAGFVPDSNDLKVANLIKLNLHYHALAPVVNASTWDLLGDCFEVVNQINVPITGGTTDLQAYGPITTITYGAYINAWENFKNYISSMKTFSNIKGDIIGAFGVSAVWTDNSINQVADYKFDDLIHPFDELFLTQLQNATIMNYDGYCFCQGSNAIVGINSDRFAYRFDNGSLGTDSDGMLELMTNPKRVPILYSAEFTKPAGSTYGFVFSPATDGYEGSISSVAGNYLESTPVLANKYNMSEGEDLEVIQLLSWCVSASFDDTDQSHTYENRYFYTNRFFVTRVRSISFENGVDIYNDMKPAYIDFDPGTGTYPNLWPIAERMMRAAQYWSQCDYGPKLPITTGHVESGRAVIKTMLLWDTNIMGSISKRTFINGIRYAFYSLLAPEIKITEVKKIDNIVNVYNLRK